MAVNKITESRVTSTPDAISALEDLKSKCMSVGIYINDLKDMRSRISDAIKQLQAMAVSNDDAAHMAAFEFRWALKQIKEESERIQNYVTELNDVSEQCDKTLGIAWGAAANVGVNENV